VEAQARAEALAIRRAYYPSTLAVVHSAMSEEVVVARQREPLRVNRENREME
jgi:hypothetical protein